MRFFRRRSISRCPTPRLVIVANFGVRRPVAALVCGGLTPRLLPDGSSINARSRQVATDQSADRSAHSRSRSKASLVFFGDDEGFDHLGVNEVAVELNQLIEPKTVARIVRVR